MAPSSNDFTNIIVTAVWGDGVNRTLAIVFTYNRRLSKKIDILSKDGVKHSMESG